MKSSTFCSLFLGLILISQSPLSANARRLLGGGLVDELCNGFGGDKIACNNVLGSNPEAMKAESYDKLAEVILTMAINKAVEGQNFLKGLAATTNSKALTQCANFDYDGVVGSFKSALGEIKSDPQTANYDAGVAHDGPDTCNRGLAAENIVNPQITALNNDILLFSQMASYATDKLDG
jgi:pectinesterase inhibitor-like protein